MKTRILASAAALLCAASVNAAIVTWDGLTDTIWSEPDTSSWGADTYNSTDDVMFGDTGVGAVTLSGTLTPKDITFSHSSGTYTLSGGTINASGNLVINGAGTAQFGNMTNAPVTATWGTTSISGGGSLYFTRGTNIGSSSSLITLNNGNLRVGADNSGTYSYDNPFSIGSGGGSVTGQWSGNQSNFNFSGNFSGNGALTLRAAGTAGNLVNAGLVISGADNSGYTGAAKIVSNGMDTAVAGGTRPTAVWFSSSSSLLTDASQVVVRDGGLLGVQFAVTDTNLANVTAGPRGGLAARGSGTLGNLADPMAYVGKGGFIALDNFNGVGDRLGDSTALALDSTRIDIIGRNVDNQAVNEQTGALTLNGGNHLYFNRRKSNNAGIVLSVASLATPGAGDTLLIETGNGGGEFATNASGSTLAITGSKPAETNGMITPAIQHFIGGNNLGHFLAYDSVDPTKLVVATYTGYASDWAGAAATEIVNLTAATILTGSGDMNVHALRIATGNQNLGGRTINLGSGGLITTSAATSNGTLNFGSGPGFIGAYNAAAQANISATISGSGGLTIMGTSQSLNLSNNANSFTGGLFVNGGTTSVTSTAANGNNVTINAFGRLTGPNANENITIGGLSGDGRLSGFFQGDSTKTNSFTISPMSGSYTFNGSIRNGDQGRVLSITKDGGGTQIFGADSVGAHTGTTTISGGTLVVDGDFSAATGNVTVASGATLGGSGTLGGAMNVSGALAPGNSIGTLNSNSDVTWNASAVAADAWKFDLGALNTSDLLNITGSFIMGTISGSEAFVFDFGGSISTGTFMLVDWTIGTSFVAGDFSYINLGGGNSGTFAINGSQLDFTVVPEPATFALLGGLGALGLVLFRRRRG